MSKHVLVVDDDPAIRGLVADFLRFEHYEVDLAANGAEALEAVKMDKPAAVLLDIMMPVMDGWSFVEQCRQDHLCDDVPIIVMSAAPGAAEQAARLNLHTCFTKPFDIEQLLGVVKRVAV